MSQGASSQRFVRALLRAAFPISTRRRIAVMLQLAFDESGTHDKRLFSVAGYISRSGQWERFSREWYEALPDKLRPFHAKRFFSWAKAHHPESNHIRDRLWGAIARRTAKGFQSSFSLADYEGAVGARLRSRYGSAYVMGVQLCLVQVSEWADRYHHEGPFAYFFEAGHPNAGQLLDHMELLKAVPDYRIGSVTFSGKCEFIPLQAADMLAHQVNAFLRSEKRHMDTSIYERKFRETSLEYVRLQSPAEIRKLIDKVEEQIKARRHTTRKHRA